jgi:hypothetical protein
VARESFAQATGVVRASSRLFALFDCAFSGFQILAAMLRQQVNACANYDHEKQSDTATDDENYFNGSRHNPPMLHASSLFALFIAA